MVAQNVVQHEPRAIVGTRAFPLSRGKMQAHLESNVCYDAISRTPHLLKTFLTKLMACRLC